MDGWTQLHTVLHIRCPVHPGCLCPVYPHRGCVFMWGLRCSNMTECQNYYVADLVPGEQEITTQGEKKKEERRILSVLTVNDRKEENKVPSSYLDSLAKTPSKMVTNYEDKKTLQLLLIIEQGRRNQRQLQGNQWSSQHCQRNGQPVPEHSGPGSGAKGALPSGRYVCWVGMTPRCHGRCWGQRRPQRGGEASAAPPDGEAGGSCSQYAVSNTPLAGYSCRRIEPAYVGGLCLKVSTV